MESFGTNNKIPAAQRDTHFMGITRSVVIDSFNAGPFLRVPIDHMYSEQYVDQDS